MTVPIPIRINQMEEEMKQLEHIKEILEESKRMQKETNKVLEELAYRNQENTGAINFLAMLMADKQND